MSDEPVIRGIDWGKEPSYTSVVKYKKNCRCFPATATTGQFRFDEQAKQTEKGLTVAVHFYPGPSCNSCGKPWVLEQGITR